MRKVKVVIAIALLLAGSALPLDANALDRKSARAEAKAICKLRLGGSAKDRNLMDKCVARQTKKLLRKEAAGEVCFTLYKPVCGLSSGGSLQTYSNECRMQYDGAEKLYEGPCKK